MEFTERINVSLISRWRAAARIKLRAHSGRMGQHYLSGATRFAIVNELTVERRIAAAILTAWKIHDFAYQPVSTIVLVVSALSRAILSVRYGYDKPVRGNYVNPPLPLLLRYMQPPGIYIMCKHGYGWSRGNKLCNFHVDGKIR